MVELLDEQWQCRQQILCRPRIALLEREAELRKLVYLDTLQQLADIATIIRKIVATATPLDEITTQAKEIGSSGWRLYGMAGLETIRALDAANREALKATMRLLPVRVHYEVLKVGVEASENSIKEAVAERERLKERISAPGVSEEERSKLEVKSEELRLRLIKDGQALIGRRKTLFDFSLQLLDLGQEVVGKYEQEVWRVTLAIRKELGFALDEESFLTLMKASSEEIQRSTQAITAELRETLVAKLFAADPPQENNRPKDSGA
jgi:Rad3-related DNA helicase